MTTLPAQLLITLCPGFNGLTTNYIAARGEMSDLMLPELEQHIADNAVSTIAELLALRHIDGYSYMVDARVMPQLLIEIADYNTRRNGESIINMEVYAV